MFKDKTIVVTGAGSGVGEATALEASLAGARVIALDINPEGPGQLSNKIESQQLDVSQEAEWAAYAATLPDQGVDYLHLNAGIQSAPADAPLDEYRFQRASLDHYRRMMGVNVDGVVYGLHHMLEKMKPGGSIVVTCSLAGIVPYDVDPLYSMSKHAVTGLVRSLKRELGEMDLRINAICPGGVDTNIIPVAQRDQAATFMQPRDIAVEVMKLFLTEESGATWAKVSAGKPAWIIYPPGKRD